MSEQTLVDRLTEIQGLRPATAEAVADAYPTADALAGATQDDLTEIKGIGAVTAARIVEAFASDAGSTATPAGDGADASADAPAEAPESGEDATVTSLDDARTDRSVTASAEEPVEQLKVAAQAVTSGAAAVVGTVKEHLPEVKESVGRAAGAVVDLGREITRVIFRRAS